MVRCLEGRGFEWRSLEWRNFEWQRVVELLQRPEDDRDRRAELVGEEAVELGAQREATREGARRVVQVVDVRRLLLHQSQELAHRRLVTHDVVRHARIIVIRTLSA